MLSIPRTTNMGYVMNNAMMYVNDINERFCFSLIETLILYCHEYPSWHQSLGIYGL